MRVALGDPSRPEMALNGILSTASGSSTKTEAGRVSAYESGNREKGRRGSQAFRLLQDHRELLDG